jgi:hypothetical protein
MALVSALLWDHYTFLMGGGYILYSGSACLLIGHCLAMADQPSWVSRVLGWRPFVVIGQVSYEAYLVHCVVILAVLRVAPQMPVADMIVLDLGLITVISGAFYYFIGQPIRRYGWLAAFRPSKRPARPARLSTTRPARSLGGILVGVASATAVVVLAVVLVATAKSTPVSPALGAGSRPGTPTAQGAAIPDKLPGPRGAGEVVGGPGKAPIDAAPASHAPQGRRPSGTDALAAGLRTPKGPRIISIAPATGSILGGNAVTLRGRHFTRHAKVYFNALRLERVTWLDNRTLRIVVPAADAVEVDRPLATLHGLQASVQVVTAGGRSEIGAATLYTFV